ncbi:MAG: hypothetical protein ACOY3L_09435 [Pseudomonadota bacterium]
MSTLFVTRSKTLSEWGSDVGLGKNLFKVGIAEDAAKEAVEALNAEAYAGQTDWMLVKGEPVEGVEEAALLEKLGQKEKMIDPKYYPRIRGALGIFKVKLENVENHMIVKMSLAGEEPKLVKPKPADIAGYLIHNALN